MVTTSLDELSSGPAATSDGARRRRGGRTSDAGNAVSKTLRVLEAVAAEREFRPLGEIAALAEVPKPTAYRILASLADEDYVIRHEKRGYASGPRLRVLTYSLMGDDGIDDVLAELSERTRQTTNFGLRSGADAIYTHKRDGAQPYQVRPNLGMRLSLHATAIGKSILAWLPRDEVRAILDRTGLPALTDLTITDLDRLLDELDETRERGWSVDDEENEKSIRCIAAPALASDGTVLGAVSVSTLTFVMERPALEALAPHVLDAARKIGALLRP